MDDLTKFFSDPSLGIVMTYAPAGLGHLRVMDALRHGLPHGVTPYVLGADETAVSAIHRFFSASSFTQAIAEWFQIGAQEELLNRWYLWYLRHSTHSLYEDIVQYVKFHPRIKRLLIVSTHYGMAHQIGFIKERLSRELGIPIVLLVQVTDDSPQLVWYVEGADALIVPSETTKQSLAAYAIRRNLSPVPLFVSSYPINPLYVSSLSSSLMSRSMILEPKGHEHISVCIPVSGASVGLAFVKQLIDALCMHPRFIMHIISKQTPQVVALIHGVSTHEQVKVHLASDDRATISIYERLYRDTGFALEITKPSEQAFKALCGPNQIGGSLLLLTKPVGKQEKDNVHFLRRHALLPTEEEHQVLWKAARDKAMTCDCLSQARNWRALQLPDDPMEASIFIQWCLEVGIFLAMTAYMPAQGDGSHQHELASDGVSQFWRIVGELLTERGKRG